ncbi:MAG TPA: TadE family protein [Actinomycetota bacterium]|nr:TadE family protein [Actinomycetota bacterium]
MNRGDRGQATLELALCLPLVALILAAVVESGLVVSDQVRLWHSAREAARVAAVDPNPEAIEDAAEASGLKPLDIQTSPQAAERRQGGAVTVALEYEPRGRVPLIGRLISVPLTASSTMRIEVP